LSGRVIPGATPDRRPSLETDPTQHPKRWLGYLLAATAAVLWATGAVTAKWMYSRLSFTVDPLTLSGARACVAFLVLIVFLAGFGRDRLKVRPRDLWFLGAFGVFGLAAVHFSYFQTIALTNVATAILLEYLAPILVLIVSVLFLGERFTWALPAGVVLSVLGCALMVGAVGGTGLVITPQGLAWGLASAFFFAVYSLMGKYASPRFSPWTLLVYGLGAASLFWIAVMGGPARILGILTRPEGLVAVLYVAVFSTILPFAAFLKSLHYIGSTKATVTATLEPAVAGVLAFLLLGETLTVVQLLGGVLVLAAIITVQAPQLFSARGSAPGASIDADEETLPPTG
jgi:drug/metabolite transporter (DMT)-like permease